MRKLNNEYKMIKTKNFYTVLLIFSAAMLMISVNGCKKDEPARETSYSLKVQDVLGVTGIATFIETSATVSTITLKLFGAPSGTHPAALYMNSVAEGGEIALELNPVDASGTSSTDVNSFSYRPPDYVRWFCKSNQKQQRTQCNFSTGRYWRQCYNRC